MFCSSTSFRTGDRKSPETKLRELYGNRDPAAISQTKTP